MNKGYCEEGFNKQLYIINRSFFCDEGNWSINNILLFGLKLDINLKVLLSLNRIFHFENVILISTTIGKFVKRN